MWQEATAATRAFLTFGCTAMDGRRGTNPGPDFWKPLFDWWLSAEPVTMTLATWPLPDTESDIDFSDPIVLAKSLPDARAG